MLIACVTALGGGSVRDMLLGHYPLTWVRHPEYLALTAVAALVTVFIAPLMRHLRSLFLVLDAGRPGGIHPDRLPGQPGDGPQAC
ncbi:membrane protein [Pseudomonas aeruginosa]|nr:membrane protein [Pseudomonas aeruginosa]